VTVEVSGDQPSGDAGTASPLGRVVARLAKQVEVALGEVDLSIAQYRALAYLAGGVAAPSALAGQLDVSKPSITALVDGLCARGYVERRPDPDDRRRVEHRLTRAGRQALTSADRAVDDRLLALLAHLDDRGTQRALAGVEAWGQSLDAARRALLSQ
jgi:long-chain acyl-CoA synthetase